MTLAFVATTSAAFAQAKHLADIREIDAALQTARLTPTQRGEVTRYRDQGAQQHYANDHGPAEVNLQKAKAILKIR
jgi:hypothetical protein